MKDWIRKWLGIKEIETVYGLRLDGHRADLDDMQRELRKTRCYEGGEEVPKTAVLHEVIERLVAVIDYLDIEFYSEQKVDESYAPPRPRLVEVKKARKKIT